MSASMILMMQESRPTKIKPIDGEWTPEVFRDYDTERLLGPTWDVDQEDWQMAYYALLEELAVRALEERSLLDDVIAALGRHMQVFPKISMGTPLGYLGLECLLNENDESIRQKLVDHANGWDAERQYNFYKKFAPDTSNEVDRTTAEQVNLLNAQEKYGFNPKFRILPSAENPNAPLFEDIVQEVS